MSAGRGFPGSARVWGVRGGCAHVAYGQLFALGPDAEVVAPAGLRERIAEAARRMADRYA
ncbi:WYL domain-containing protein [Streptomyces antnestii]|uniref:WYL domain-containing protein n=1 Tax=Streptomyces antnestii TaxID=2494256 RepID=UPI0026A4FB9F